MINQCSKLIFFLRSYIKKSENFFIFFKINFNIIFFKRKKSNLFIFKNFLSINFLSRPKKMVRLKWYAEFSKYFISNFLWLKLTLLNKKQRLLILVFLPRSIKSKLINNLSKKLIKIFIIKKIIKIIFNQKLNGIFIF